MRIISKSRLREFWESRTQDRETAKRDLLAWYAIAKIASWANFGEMRRTFGSADKVGRCVVFDVGNNRFRMIARIFFETRTLFVLKVMDHEEYDENRWPDECECHFPKPRKRTSNGDSIPPKRKGR